MKHLVWLLLTAITLTGCHSGKSAAERAAGKRIAELADSVKYEALRADFEKGNFLFKISRVGDLQVDPTKSRVAFYDGKVRLQVVTFSKKSMIDGRILSGTIKEINKTVDKKKRTIALSGEINMAQRLGSNLLTKFSFTLYPGSNKGYGYISDFSPSHKPTMSPTFEGWYEPVTPADTTGYVPLR